MTGFCIFLRFCTETKTEFDSRWLWTWTQTSLHLNSAALCCLLGETNKKAAAAHKLLLFIINALWKEKVIISIVIRWFESCPPRYWTRAAGFWFMWTGPKLLLLFLLIFQGQHAAALCVNILIYCLKYCFRSLQCKVLVCVCGSPALLTGFKRGNLSTEKVTIFTLE